MQEKLSFIDVFQKTPIDYDDFIKVAASHNPSVPPYIIKNMMGAKPVKRMYAEAVLTILARYTGKILTLDTVEVPLLEGDAHVTK